MFVFRIKEELPTFEEKINIANSTLRFVDILSIHCGKKVFIISNLEKATKELQPEDDLISPQILYPALAASVIVNLLMGGHILSQVMSSDI